MLTSKPKSDKNGPKKTKTVFYKCVLEIPFDIFFRFGWLHFENNSQNGCTLIYNILCIAFWEQAQNCLLLYWGMCALAGATRGGSFSQKIESANSVQLSWAVEPQVFHHALWHQLWVSRLCTPAYRGLRVHDSRLRLKPNLDQLYLSRLSSAKPAKLISLKLPHQEIGKMAENVKPAIMASLSWPDMA